MKKISLLVIILAMITLSAWSFVDQTIGTEEVSVSPISLDSIFDAPSSNGPHFVSHTNETKSTIIFANAEDGRDMIVEYGLLPSLSIYIYINSRVNDSLVYDNKREYNISRISDQISLV